MCDNCENSHVCYCSLLDPLSFDAPFPRNPSKYPLIPYISRIRIIDLHFAANSMRLPSFKFF